MFGSEFGGIRLASEYPLPELPTPSDVQDAQLRVVSLTAQLLSPESSVHAWTDGLDVVLSLAVVDGCHVLTFNDGKSFGFDRESRTVTHPSPLDPWVRHLLLDQVLPRVLEHLGHLMIHGSAIDAPKGAVIFIGNTGVGKSTLVASFEDSGIGLLSDDCMRLTTDRDGSVSCLPTYRSLRLWPDSAEAVMPSAPFESMAADSDKRRLDLPEPPPVGHSTVAAICVLSEPNEDCHALALQPVAPSRAVSLLVAQCFRLDPTDAEATKRTFERCADVVERVPVVELSYPRDYDRLPEVREAVLQRAAKGDWTTVTAT